MMRLRSSIASPLLRGLRSAVPNRCNTASLTMRSTRNLSSSSSAPTSGTTTATTTAASAGGRAGAEAETALPTHWFHKHNYPLFALAIGITALCFQIKILYPWHAELSDQFENLTKTATMVNDIAVDMRTKLARLTEMEQLVRQDEISIFSKQQIVLKQEGEVMDALKTISKKVQELKK